MCLCQLEFFTNKNNKYGPYGSASSCCGCYEGKRLTIIFFNIFFKGFKNVLQIFVFILWIVNNVPCDWSEAIKMDRFPVGFAGASVSVFLYTIFIYYSISEIMLYFREKNYVVKFN